MAGLPSYDAVTMIFTTKPACGGRGYSIIARSDRRPDTQVIVRGVQAADDVAVDVLQPRHLHAGEHFRGTSVTAVKGRGDDGQRRLSVCRTNGLGPAVDARHSRVTRACSRDGDVRDVGRARL